MGGSHENNGGGKGRGWGEKKIFTTGEAAEVCKVSQQTIIRCFDSGRLNGFRVPGSRFRRIPREELLRFMRENDIPLDTLEPPTKRVLIVDDDPRVLEVFLEVFGRDDRFSVRTASTGYEAGVETEAFKPHLIVLDYMLPDINGNVVCQRLRAHDATRETKVLFVSGVVDPKEVEGLKKSGGDDFLKKPFRIDELMSRVERLLEV
ncbi:MAG: response regulator [Phycisphaerales bacterium]|nr:response regulator [Phycisphaerales bacterium]MCA9306208.1 response regulator [Phycisphaerales bacterium]